MSQSYVGLLRGLLLWDNDGIRERSTYSCFTPKVQHLAGGLEAMLNCVGKSNRSFVGRRGKAGSSASFVETPRWDEPRPCHWFYAPLAGTPHMLSSVIAALDGADAGLAVPSSAWKNMEELGI
jgi:hypothetical protein